MIELIILLVPGIIAALFHCKLNKCMNWKKFLLSYILYTICINLTIYSALWIVGMRHFNLSEMSLKFKIKWFALAAVLAILFVITYKNLRNMSTNTLKNMLKRLLPAILLLTVTYAVYTPSSLFLENIDEFMIDYINIAPIIICVALLLWIIINGAAICLTTEKNIHYYIALIFALSLCAYIQQNFLNPNLPSLDGTPIDWAAYSVEGKISAIFWCLCIIIIIAAAFYFKDKSEKIIKYIAYFLSAVQLVSLIILIITMRLPANAKYGFSKIDEFTLGSQENIVIFIIDTLQSSVLEEYLSSDAYPEGSLDDFTCFNNAVSGGAPTHVAVPLLLTGIEYDPMQSFKEYQQEIWEETSIYDDMHERGYDVRFFTTNNAISNIPNNVADNYGITIDSHIDDHYEFGKLLYKLANFYTMPQFLKQQFWMTTETIMETVNNSNITYSTNNVTFYKDMQSAEHIQVNYDKAFRLYHLRGVHSPYYTNEYLQGVEYGSVTELQQLQGVLMALYSYIDEMKNAGVYDASTIIILGDHGKHEQNNTESNPAVLIKQPYETHELSYNSAPIHFRNIVATMANTIMEDYSAYGPCVNDITNESDVERLHTIDDSIRKRNHIDDEWDEGYDYCRLITPYQLDETDQYKVWNPHNINRIDYTLGDTIDFTANNSYSQQINYRLYKENQTAIASNELSICFNLTNYEKKDLEFCYTYSHVYNGEQKIRIYANGSKIDTVTCTEEGAETDCSIVIPKNKMQNNELVIRMVFPNAVTPNQLDRTNTDTRVLSVEFDSMRLE